MSDDIKIGSEVVVFDRPMGKDNPPPPPGGELRGGQQGKVIRMTDTTVLVKMSGRTNELRWVKRDSSRIKLIMDPETALRRDWSRRGIPAERHDEIIETYRWKFNNTGKRMTGQEFERIRQDGLRSVADELPEDLQEFVAWDGQHR